MCSQEEVFAVSPSTPLLSTAIDENGWVCGGFPASTDLLHCAGAQTVQGMSFSTAACSMDCGRYLESCQLSFWGFGMSQTAKEVINTEDEGRMWQPMLSKGSA